MPSKLIGRVECPECGFGAAHVKQKTEGDTAKLPYRYCPECGAQYFPKSEAAAARLTAKMRPEGGAAVKPATEPEKNGETGATAGSGGAAAAPPAGGGGEGAKKEAEAPAAVKTKKRGFLEGVV